MAHRRLGESRGGDRELLLEGFASSGGEGALFTSRAGLLDPWKDFSVSPASGGLAYKSYENPQAGGHGESCSPRGGREVALGRAALLPMGVGHGQPRALPKDLGVVGGGGTNAKSRWSSPRHQPSEASWA